MRGEREILVEGHKSFFDYFRHITTLDTAAILITIAFYERSFKHPRETYLAVIAFGFFLLSLICSVLIMKRFALVIWYEEEGTSGPKMNEFVQKFYILGSLWGFILGIILLGIFGAINILCPISYVLLR